MGSRREVLTHEYSDNLFLQVIGKSINYQNNMAVKI